MANVSARFKLIDEMSDKLGSMAETGQNMVAQWEQAGEAVNAAFSRISGTVTTAASSVDGVANSISDLQGSASDAASHADSLADSLNDYGDAAGSAADQIDDLEEAVAEQEETMRQCEQAAEGLGDSLKQACETEEKLAETMEKAARVSEELSDNDKVSAETKEALARASQEAEDAMQELTAAQQEAEAAMAEYEAALSSGTDNLEELEQAAERVSAASDALDEANRRAADATEELADSTERAADEAENGSERGQDAAKQLASALTAAGIATLIRDMAAAYMEASEAAAEFEVATMKISTIADTTQVPLSQMSADLINLSRETGISVAGLSEATYSALSASVNTADAIGFTATASKLAAGGFTSSATAVDVLTTALNAYGLEAGQAESISDMLITTQNLGKTTVDELAASVGKVIPLASAYGVEMDNLSAAYAELTKGGIATAEAGTYLKSMLNELGDSGSTVNEVLSEMTGQSFAQLIEHGYSLGDIMAVLGESVNGNAGAFNELWSSSEAGIGALALYNAGAEQFNSTLDAMQTSIGATESAYSTMTDTTAHAQEELSNAAENLKIAIGQNLNPLVEKLYGLGTKVLNGMSQFAQEHPVAVKAISAIGIGLGVAAAAMVAVATATTVAIPAITAFGTALNAALGPIGWIAIGITALVAAGVALAAMLSDVSDETAGMTATTREQYYELQELNAEYEEACEKYGETSEEASRLKYQVDDLSAAFESNRQTVEEFVAEVDALCESVRQVTSDFNDGMTSIKSAETGSLALIQKYEDLATQAELTGAQEKELEAVTKKLAESYPDLAAQMDGATLSTEDYVAAMKKACEQMAEEQRQQQAQETYIEALQKQAELEEEIAKAEANLNAEREAAGMYYDEQMQQWTNGWYTEDSLWADWTTDLSKYNEALEELNAAQAENDATIAQIEKGWENISAAEEAAAEETISWEQAAAEAYQSVQGRIEELCAAYDEAYQAALESFSGQFGLFDEAEADMEATVASAQAALDSQLAYWEQYAANIDVLKNTSAEDLGITQENYDAIMATVQDGSEQAAGLAANMVAAINEGDAEAVAALANTLGEVQAKQAEIAQATADWQTDFESQMQGIVDDMQGYVDDLNLSEEASASAKSTINSYASSIRAGKADAVAAAQEVANAVTAALAAAQAKINVQVSSSGSVPGHAKGTTYAEPVFLAGEEGPELVARRAAAYATGTTNSADYFIAGENGPELIVGEQGSTVFPTSETDRLINALNTKSQPLHVTAESGSGANVDKTSATEQVKRILLEIAGSGTIEVSGNGGADKEMILEVLIEHAKPVFMNLIQSEIYEEGDLAYDF